MSQGYIKLRAQAFIAAGHSPEKALELSRKEFEKNNPPKKPKKLPAKKEEK